MSETKQLQHDPVYAGGPCSRCGLRYSRETSYVPCLTEGESFETWLGRQNEAVQDLVNKK